MVVMEAVKTRGNRKKEQGIVISDKMDKTIRVKVEELRKHPKYKKYVRYSKVLFAHDENNEAKQGDLVEIMETRPLSKLKRWRLCRIIKRSEA